MLNITDPRPEGKKTLGSHFQHRSNLYYLDSQLVSQN